MYVFCFFKVTIDVSALALFWPWCQLQFPTKPVSGALYIFWYTVATQPAGSEETKQSLHALQIHWNRWHLLQGADKFYDMLVESDIAHDRLNAFSAAAVSGDTAHHQVYTSIDDESLA